MDLTRYDALNRPTATVQNYVASGPTDFQTNVTTATTYDQGGRALTVTDPVGRVAVTSYDALGRRVAQTQNCVGSAAGVCDGPVTTDQNVTTRWALDAAGDVMAEQAARTGGSDGAHLTTGYVYDGLFRLVQVTEDQGMAAAGHLDLVTQYRYDLSGDRLAVSDGLGKATVTALGDLGRTVSATDASGHVQQTRCSPAGLLDERGRVLHVGIDFPRL